ncbi:helix-turn-helix domain-containing protein [Clostridium botulinum]|uniref:Helix-turn-helix transcriptional regulator n=1 Tax=Clostridium botulinum TaxID=1491 RepID=A0A6G4H4P5_CLOBO|nr:helix-turn-helix transcriptional regulator [Clostridium botulinum]MBY6842220.1 helix-turn-helix transcriptional regulator [Clostridium botulinum]MBY6844464.1 helix-turn-helix transcriptional regulator [Clostridium botulinum]NFH35986.1 helix-turn-helix transcriptional regulator [Clostridium botulinum]NFO72226.1 helix-turn-helix transcriptional regulator [Clostridium botulinum]NFU28459.1 helix-turn-helix transcriptional regulator [Clostridium botulinum]
MSNLGERLKELRNEAKLSQKDLAKKLGLSSSTVGMIESGKRKGNKETIQKIANFFEVSIDYLYGNDIEEITKTESLIDNFLDRLIEEDIIQDANNIDSATENMILNAIKAEIALKLKKKNN